MPDPVPAMPTLSEIEDALMDVLRPRLPHLSEADLRAVAISEIQRRARIDAV